MTRRQNCLIVLLCLLLAYVGSYVVLSRRGMAWSEMHGCKGFYFFPPEESNSWRIKHYGCVCLYYPLNLIDNLLGLGTPMALSEPMWRLSES